MDKDTQALVKGSVSEIGDGVGLNVGGAGE